MKENLVIEKYDKLEALKNKCLPISFRKLIIIMILCVLLILTLNIFSPFILKIPEFLTTIIIIFTLVGIPIISCIIYFNYIKWFSTAFIIKDKNIYLVQLINYDLTKNNQNINVIHPSYEFVSKNCEYLNMLNDYILQKEIQGKVKLLNNLRILNENDKYYKCIYNDNGGKCIPLKIPKAYKNISEIIRSVQNG